MSLPPRLSPDDILDLLSRVDAESEYANEVLRHATPIVQAAGLTVHSSVLDTTFIRPPAIPGTPSAAAATAATSTDPNNNNYNENADQKEAALACLHARETYNPLRGTLSAFPFVLSTTGGYSNTDHIIHQNPTDGSIDKLSEFKRKLKRRVRQSQLDEQNINSTTNSSSYKWDLPRIPGGRRRRIKRDTDAPTAPPRPPEQGYLMFVTQMTTKLRHDNPERLHDQISAIKRISPMWNSMREEERSHYTDMAKEAREEYLGMLREFRATGGYRPFKCIEQVRNKREINNEESNDNNSSSSGGNEDHRNSLGPWVRIPYAKKNALEREIETYDVVSFPPRPPGMDEAYEKRQLESRKRRRRKIVEEGIRYY